MKDREGFLFKLCIALGLIIICLAVLAANPSCTTSRIEVFREVTKDV